MILLGNKGIMWEMALVFYFSFVGRKSPKMNSSE